jgi:hypothetical protein
VKLIFKIDSHHYHPITDKNQVQSPDFFGVCLTSEAEGTPDDTDEIIYATDKKYRIYR